jgi:uncharacterized membrane protein
MIFDHRDEHMDEPMMGWGPYMWFYMILGLFIFLIIVIILIYLVNRGTRKNKELLKSNRESIQVGVVEEIQSENPYFCPNCGEKLEDNALRYCPSCGSAI